jgi:hypothetical protein
MLAVCDLMRDSDSDAISGQCHTHTTAPVMGFVVINSRSVTNWWRGISTFSVYPPPPIERVG